MQDDVEQATKGYLADLGFDSRRVAVNVNSDTFIGPGNIKFIRFKVYIQPFGFQDPLIATVQSPRADGSIVPFAISGNYTVAGVTDIDGTRLITQNGQAFQFNPKRAFRWTLGTGVQDLGVLPTFDDSGAYAISRDGNTVVGAVSRLNGSVNYLNSGFGQRAFRWTQPLGMQDLGATTSAATGVNGDGSIVIGKLANISGAFRWDLSDAATGAGKLTTLQGLTATSFTNANAISSDGTTIVGDSQIGGIGTFQTLPVRWVSGGAPQSLGLPTGTAQATAFAVNRDGSVIVGTADVAGGTGYSYSPSGGFTINGSGAGAPTVLAFRWTQLTGSQTLNAIATAGGINMTGVSFLSATSVTGDGQFISGTVLAPFAVGGGVSISLQQSYVLRVCDATTAAACAGVTTTTTTTTTVTTTPVVTVTPIVGLTTAASVLASVNQLADERSKLMAQQHGLTAELLGGNQPIGNGTELGIFASGGSAEAGGFGRIAFGNGFTLLNGIAYASERYRRTGVDQMVLAAGALRYVHSLGGVDPFVEVGGWTAQNGRYSFERTYANGGGTAGGNFKTNGTMTYVYGRLGVAFRPTTADEAAVSAEFGHQWLNTGAGAEALSQLNPFQATVLRARDEANVGKLRAQWTHRFTDTIDATVWAAAAGTSNAKSTLVAFVPGFGLVAPAQRPRTAWAEFGARVGYKLTKNLTVDVFADGVSGEKRRVGSSAHGGAALRVSF